MEDLREQESRRKKEWFFFGSNYPDNRFYESRTIVSTTLSGSVNP
jgi:hypothetical protein